jgi:hypothetical protein
MKITFGFLSFLLTCLAVILYLYGDAERFSAFYEKYDDTAHEERAAVAEAYRQSWGIEKWTITSGASVCAAIAFGIAAFKRPKNRPPETD